MPSRTFHARAALGVAVLLALTVPGVSATADPATNPTVGVTWHMQSGKSGPVDGASASLTRTDSGIAYRFHARELTPEHAYTLWLVVIDHPEQCQTTPCAAGDFLVNDGPDAQVTFAAGHVVGGSGTTTFAGHRSAGDIEGWLDDRSFDNPRGAEVHLVVNDHGPRLAEHMPGMIHTYRGGCSDSSPFPAVFPPSALADGEPGPNTCLLTQAAVFVP